MMRIIHKGLYDKETENNILHLKDPTDPNTDDEVHEDFFKIFKKFAYSSEVLNLNESDVREIENNGENVETRIRKLIEKCLQKRVMPENLADSWRGWLNEEFEKEYFLLLDLFVRIERRFYKVHPPREEVFAWSKHCKVEDVKVVIVGQDPVPSNKAHGLCFSSRRSSNRAEDSPTKSLKNIFAALEADKDVPEFKRPSHGNLLGWAKQDVLLLNVGMTVRDKPTSHMYINDWTEDIGWQQFTGAIIKLVNDECKNVVFML